MYEIFHRSSPTGLTYTGKGAHRAALAAARDLGYGDRHAHYHVVQRS